MGNRNQLHVVIPTHGRPDLLVRTLSSLAECGLPENYAGCIVAENGGQKGAEDAVRNADPRLRCRYFYNDQGNKSATLNAVFKQFSLDDWVILFDDDVRFSPTILQEYAQAIGGLSAGKFFCGPAAIDYEQRPPEWLIEYLPPSAKGWKWDANVPVTTPIALGFNWAVHTKDVQAVGGFDARFGPGSSTRATGQESNLQRQLIEMGIYGQYVEKAKVWHYVPKDRCSADWVIERHYRNGRSSGIQFRKTECRTVFGYPSWLLRKYVSEVILQTIKAPFCSPSNNFRVRIKLSSLRGTLAAARAWSETPGDCTEN